MMQHLIPKPLRLLGFDHAPQVVTTQLLEIEALARLNLEPDHDHSKLEKLMTVALEATQWAMDKAPTLSELLARALFQEMIDLSRAEKSCSSSPIHWPPSGAAAWSEEVSS